MKDGSAFQRLLEENKLTQDELAREASIHRSQLSQVIRGKRPISVEAATSILRVLNARQAHIPFAILFDEDATKPATNARTSPATVVSAA